MQKLNKLIAWIGFTVFSLPALAQEIHQFSVQQAVEYAKKNSVQVKNALLDVRIQQQTNRDITSGALPQLTGNGSFSDYLKIPTTLLPGEIIGQPSGTFVPVQFGTKYNANAGLNLQQTLFDGQVFVGLQARSTSIEWQKKNVEITEENIKANIYKIYYQLVVGITQIDYLNTNITRLEKLQHDTKELYKNGFAEKLDEDKLAVQAANLQTEKLKATNNLEIGYFGLKVLMGMPIKDSLVLTDTISDDQIKSESLDLGTYNYKDRKDYQYAELGEKLKQFNIKRYRLSYIPVLNATGAYTKNAQRKDFDFFKGGSWYTTSYIGLNLTVPIFDGFSKDAKIKKARFELQQTVNQIEALKLSIDQDAASAKLKFVAAIATLDYQKKNMTLAETVYNQTKKKFEIGTGSNIEITGAETDLKQAQTNYIGAVYDAIIAKIDYLKAVGKL